MTKSTRRALLSSVVALVLCLTMLIGTTFAWFTDTASTSVNTIQSGKLDVDIVDINGDSLEGETLGFVKIESVSEKNGVTYGCKGTAIEDGILWEPGCTYVTEPFTIKNKGNLALKYQLIVNGYDTEGTSDLMSAIDWYIGVCSVDDDGEYLVGYAINEALSISNALTQLGENNILPGEYAYGESGYLVLVGHMREDAGNEYQGLTASNNITITVVATQATYESDSISNQYDENATLPAIATTAEEFENALASDATEIVIGSDITYNWGTESYANANNLAMSEKTFIGVTGNETITFVGYGSANNIKDVTLKNIKVADNTTGDDETSWEHGYLEFDNLTAENVVFVDGIQLNGTCTLTDCTFTGKDTPGLVMYAVWVNSGNSTFTDCKFVGTRGLKTHEQYDSDVESITVDGCTFTLTDKPGVVIGTLDATTTVTIKNSTFDGCAAGDQGKYIYESDTAVDTFNFTETNNTVK